MPEVGQTYTPNNSWEEKARALRTSVGNNPAAIKAAFAAEQARTNPQLQEAISGQTSALDQMRMADTQFAKEMAASRQANVQQGVIDANRRNFTAGLGATDPNSAARTIAMGPANLDIAAFAQNYRPVEASLTPFTASGAADVTSGSGQKSYDLAASQRGSLERAIGTDAQAVADIAQYQITKEENDRKAKELEARRSYEDQRDYLKLVGGNVTNPFTGKVEHYPSPAEIEAQKAKNGQSVFQKKSTSGKTFYDDVVDGKGSFIDVIRQNPGLTDEEKVALAKLNTDTFGAFRESNQDLIDMGLGWVVAAKLNKESNEPVQDPAPYIKAVQDGSIQISAVPVGIKDTVLKGVQDLGGVKPTTNSVQGQQITSLVDDILKDNTKPITGLMRFGLIDPFNPGAKRTKAKLDQLMGILQLAAAGQLKGQGAISENERKILNDAVSSLGLDPSGTSTLSDEDFRAELLKLSSNYNGTPMNSSIQPNINPAPTPQTVGRFQIKIK